MGIASFITSALVAILSGFLSFSSLAERTIVVSLEQLGYSPTTVEYTAPLPSTKDEEKDSAPTTEEVDDLAVLPSLYEKQEYGGPIPKILLEHSTSQSAAIVLTPKEPEVIPVATTTPIPSIAHDVSLNEALVNIFCTLKTKNEIRGTTGSGVFIDERGVILTNAHVAQFLLLAHKESGMTTTCSIRTGSPAVAHYEAELLYIPPLWVNENVNELRSETPSGTGERDYALLYITKAVEGTLPDHFPAISYDTTPLGNSAKNQAVIAAGFPAEIIRTDGLKAALNPVIATTTVTELFTYTKNKVDLIGIAPSAVGEGGSSGGPITTLSNKVIGIIATRGDSVKEGEKSLRAITLPYIDRTIREEMGVGLRDYLVDKLPERALIFRNTVAPILSRMVREAVTDSQ